MQEPAYRVEITCDLRDRSAERWGPGGEGGLLCVEYSAKIGFKGEDVYDSELTQLESSENSREARDEDFAEATTSSDLHSFEYCTPANRTASMLTLQIG